MESGWTGSSGSFTFGDVTVLRASAGQTIYTTHSLDIHYKVRVLVALWSLSGGGTFTYWLKDSSGNNLGTSPTTPTLARADYSADPLQSYDAYGAFTSA